MTKSQRKVWFQVHGWLSLPIWILFSVVCLTGTIAVVSHELTWLFNPDARADNPDRLPARPLPELVQQVEQVVPGADVGNVFVLEPYLVTAISFSTQDSPQAIAYVNPYTGDVQAINRGITFINFMRSLHGWLLFPWHHNFSVGYYLVAAMSLVVVGAAISGMVVYKRFWRAFLRPTVRWGQGARILLGDMHRQAGVWSLWFLLVMGLTGFWYMVQAVLWHNDVDVWEHPSPIGLEVVPHSNAGIPPQLTFEQALTLAQDALPELQPAWVGMPEHSRDYYTIAGGADSIFFDQYSMRAFINPWNGKIAQTRHPASMDLLQTLTHVADPLHYGTIGGLWTKLIWFVFGVVLSSMSVTGFIIYSKRTLKGRRPGAVPRSAKYPEVVSLGESQS